MRPEILRRWNTSQVAIRCGFPQPRCGGVINVSQLLGYWPKFKNPPAQNQKIDGEIFVFFRGISMCFPCIIPIWHHVNRFCEDMELLWSCPVHSIPSSIISSVDFLWLRLTYGLSEVGGVHMTLLFQQLMYCICIYIYSEYASSWSKVSELWYPTRFYSDCHDLYVEWTIISRHLIWSAQPESIWRCAEVFVFGALNLKLLFLCINWTMKLSCWVLFRGCAKHEQEIKTAEL